jgi:hypothetical protein
MPSIRLIDNDEPVTSCRCCGSPIKWFTTLTGRRMPMDVSAVPLGVQPRILAGDSTVLYDAAGSHWTTCVRPPERRR